MKVYGELSYTLNQVDVFQFIMEVLHATLKFATLIIIF